MKSPISYELPRIGAHKSIALSIDLAVDRAIKSSCECLQIFTRPPRRWAAGKNTLNPSSVSLFIEKATQAGYYDLAVHMPYLPNLASPDDGIYFRSLQVLEEEVQSLDSLNGLYLITHLGSPKDLDNGFAANRVANALNQVLENLDENQMILLENSTSKRKTWGTKTEDIEKILNLVTKSEKVGICFDTAHAFSSGYDISTSEGLHEVFDLIESQIGKNKVKVVHLNDSKGSLGSGIDHHEHIGKGEIGIECFRELMQNRRFKELPMILETPKDRDKGDYVNISLLKRLRAFLS
ncbi:MAG: deoxyribonuclease IV [Candidatus Heimdallarchaeota archaeon]